MVAIKPERSCAFCSPGPAHPCRWCLGGQGLGVVSHCGTKDVPVVPSIYFDFIFVSFSPNFISTESGKVESWGRTRGRKRKGVFLEVLVIPAHFPYCLQLWLNNLPSVLPAGREVGFLICEMEIKVPPSL